MEWTFQSDHLWRELVWEAVADNFRITLNKICCMLKPEVFGNCHAVEPIGSTSPLDGDMMMINCDSNATDSVDWSVGLVDKLDGNNGSDASFQYTNPKGSKQPVQKKDKLVEIGGLDASFQYTNPKHSNQPVQKKKHDVEGVISFVENGELDISYQDKLLSVQPQPLLIVPSKPNESENFTFDCKSRGHSNNPLTKRNNDWERVDNMIDYRAESCFDAIIEYALISSGNSRPSNPLTENVGNPLKKLTEKVRKHLSYLGWEIEFMNKDASRFRYTSPEGKTYLSLRQVYQDLHQLAVEIYSPISPDDHRSVLSTYEDLEFPPVELQMNDLLCPLIEKPQPSEGKCTVPCLGDRVDIDGEYFPHAVVQYYFHGLDRKDAVQVSNLKSQAKKHLIFMGWTIWFSNRRGRREFRYLSP